MASNNRVVAKAQERPAETASLSVAGLIVLALAAFDVQVTEAEAAGVIVALGSVAAIVTKIVNRNRV